jgi:hypothetical protein
MRGKKDYAAVKGVLDDALPGFRHNIGTKLKREYLRRGSVIFNHTTDFANVKQPDESPREAFYTIMFMREFARDARDYELPQKLKQWRPNLCDTKDPFALPAEFGRIQQTIATVIQQDVVCKDGIFFNGLRGMTNEVIEGILAAQCDERPFMTLQGVLPFPPKQRLTEELRKQKEKEKEEEEKEKEKQKQKQKQKM